MKTRIFIIVMALIPMSFIYGVTGEIIVKFFNSTTSKFDLTLSTNEYNWTWDEANLKIILDQTAYPRSFTGIQEVDFDSPKSQDDGNYLIPWGLIDFGISVKSESGTFLFRTGFTLDLRDVDWSTDTEKYPAHDTYIIIHEADSAIYLKHGSDSLRLIGNTVKIWEFWGNDNANTFGFTVPVKLENRIENTNFDFGFLKQNGVTNVPSGQNGFFEPDKTQSVRNGTIDTNYNNERKYSFNWEHNDKVTPSVEQNIYGAQFNFTVTNKNQNKSITRKFRTVYKLTVKNNLAENNGISADEIYFKDPTIDPKFHLYSAAGSGFIKNEAFDSLNIDVGDLTNQKYAIKAKPNFVYQGRTYYWQDGDFNPNTQTDLSINENSKLQGYAALQQHKRIQKQQPAKDCKNSKR